MTYTDVLDECANCTHYAYAHTLSGPVQARVRKTCTHVDARGPCGCKKFIAVKEVRYVPGVLSALPARAEEANLRAP
jgi:hypothetical protein